MSLALACPLLAQPGTYFACGEDAAAWTRILSAVNFSPAAEKSAAVAACNTSVAGDPAVVVLTGDSPQSRALGFTREARTASVRNVVDAHAPELKIVWRESVTVPVMRTPEGATVFVREKWTGAPLVAGLVREGRRHLWLAAGPGEQGFERYPYLLQALGDLGVEFPYRSRRLWAFFDSSYRSRVDLDYFARRWRDAGIAALQVASWHYMEPDAGRDRYLTDLIEACHRHSILVYAWIELPHVSERFWDAHPEWREKTALLQDAHLDWRRLMNLANADCAEAVQDLVSSMLHRFDWDGVNLAELYFESPLGYANAARFTPMNEDVRQAFRRTRGFDPMEAFQQGSRRYYGRDAASMRLFLDFRADLAYRLQTEWVRRLQAARSSKPYLDLVLTHVDDRLDQTMRDTIGADSPRTLEFAEQENIRFLVEDPATVWDRGPKRYTELAGLYAKIAKRRDLLGIDINIVERYQDVYPTRQQTGIEFLQLVNLAARAFPQVALYFEASIAKPDLPLLASAAAVAARDGNAWIVGDKVGIRWTRGPAKVNGVLWPFQDDETLWLPAGKVEARESAVAPPFRILDFTADIAGAWWERQEFEWTYMSPARVRITLDRAAPVRVDGVETSLAGASGWLPPGRHQIRVQAAAGVPGTD